MYNSYLTCVIFNQLSVERQNRFYILRIHSSSCVTTDSTILQYSIRLLLGFVLSGKPYNVFWEMNCICVQNLLLFTHNLLSLS